MLRLLSLLCLRQVNNLFPHLLTVFRTKVDDLKSVECGLALLRCLVLVGILMTARPS